jgi:Flp pilus assembly CpaF family ATPase
VSFPSSPFKGLASFGEGEYDRRFFFGREREAEIVAANLMAARLTVLYGPSGVGKSSLLRAGVAQRLRSLVPAGATEEGGAHVAIVDSWRDDPILAVAAAVGGPMDVPLVDALAERAIASGGELYLILDQMEEYVLYHGRDGGPLAGALEDVLRRSDLPVHVLLGVRDDSLADLDALKRRLPGLFGNLLRLDHLTRAAARTAIEGPLRAYSELGGPAVSAEDELVRRAIAAYFHAGKFQVLLDLEGVTDIMVNAHDAIWLQRVDGTLERYCEPIFADAADLRDEVAHLARRAGGTERRFDDAKPLLVLRLPDGSRLAAVMNVSPVPQVAIRRNVLPDASLDDLERRGTIDRAMHSLLTAAMRAGMRVVVSGETGAGKTTLLRAMTNVLPAETRIVVVEETRELDLGADPARAGSVLEWETREANIEGVGEIAQRELVRHALRFNPAWLIVGEVRDGDAAREMLLAMQHGHPSLSTVHHHSARSAWKKLAQYVAQGAEAVEFPIAALLISDAVDLFVHLGRDRDGRRVVSEICEVAGWNGTEVQLNRLFVPGPDGRGRPRPHLTDARRSTLRDHGFEDHLLLDEAGWWAS